eukprot:6390576-Prymnesium_polylepis.1
MMALAGNTPCFPPRRPFIPLGVLGVHVALLSIVPRAVGPHAVPCIERQCADAANASIASDSRCVPAVAAADWLSQPMSGWEPRLWTAQVFAGIEYDVTALRYTRTNRADPTSLAYEQVSTVLSSQRRFNATEVHSLRLLPNGSVVMTVTAQAPPTLNLSFTFVRQPDVHPIAVDRHHEPHRPSCARRPPSSSCASTLDSHVQLDARRPCGSVVQRDSQHDVQVDADRAVSARERSSHLSAGPRQSRAGDALPHIPARLGLLVHGIGARLCGRDKEHHIHIAHHGGSCHALQRAREGLRPLGSSCPRIAARRVHGCGRPRRHCRDQGPGADAHSAGATNDRRLLHSLLRDEQPTHLPMGEAAVLARHQPNRARVARRGVRRAGPPGNGGHWRVAPPLLCRPVDAARWV